MGCRSEYMEPSAQEQYSRDVAKLVIFAAHEMSGLDIVAIEPWIGEAANNIYGAPTRHDELTFRLCALCNGMNEAQRERIIYNGHDETSRKLAVWWDNHQKVDAEREAAEANEASMRTMATDIISLLGPRQKEAMKFAVENGML